MKKYIFLLCITLILIVFVGSLELSTDEPIITDEIEIITISSEIVDVDLDQPEVDTLYIAKNLDGFVAIFVPNNDKPLFTTDIAVVTLPHKDQQLLDVGINLTEHYTLEEFIENYGS